MNTLDEESEDEFDWEEVEIPALEITLNVAPKKKESDKKKPNYHAERLRRLECHKLHTLCLLANAHIRNKWINDELLHARLLSLTPMAIQNSFGMIHKSRVPDAGKRGRMFETAMDTLVSWWSQEFEVESGGHIRNIPYSEVQVALEKGKYLVSDLLLDETTLGDILDDDGEVIRNEKSLMKHALLNRGTRDTSAQLFTSLCRALDIPTRLVVSLQSVPWQAGVGKSRTTPVKKSKGKDTATQSADMDEDEDMEEVSIPSAKAKGKQKESTISEPMSEKARGKQKADNRPPIKLRKTKAKSSSNSASPVSKRSNPLYSPPVMWTEVFSRPDGRWMPIDPIRGYVNRRTQFDPTPWAASGQVSQLGRSMGKKPIPSQSVKDNRMVYVVAFEEDGYARDVTRRYAREFAAKVSKVQGGAGGGGKAQRFWWDSILSFLTRPYRLQRDDVEDEELLAAEMQEGMPSTMSGFKDHPLYALERHLKQQEVIHPPPPDTIELGKFKGEPVYPRSSIVSLKTAENWLRSEGRTIREGQQALKLVKYKASTIGRMRELEVLKDELRTAGNSVDDDDTVVGSTGNSENEVMQGLYANFQTEPFVPDPVIDGIVPKNNFGNVDLYVPSMLPLGAAHVPFKGTAKIARKLGLDFGEAITGFEFKKRRAFPVVEGIVIAAQNESLLLDAFWEAEREAEEKAQRKREERALKNWTQMIQGLRIRQRIQDQYADPQSSSSSAHVNHDQQQGANYGEDRDESGEQTQNQIESTLGVSGGGFVVGVDDVVQAYNMPKPQHDAYRDDSIGTTLKSFGIHPPIRSEESQPRQSEDHVSLDDDVQSIIAFHTMDIDDDDGVDIAMDDARGAGRQSSSVIPKTMQDLAQSEASLSRISSRSRRRSQKGKGGDATPNGIISTPPISSSRTSPQKGKGKAGDPDSRATRRSSRKKRRRQSLDSDTELEPELDVGWNTPQLSSSPGPGIGSTSVVPNTNPSSGRTLRPRKNKSEAQRVREEEEERAYKRAIAQ